MSAMERAIAAVVVDLWRAQRMPVRTLIVAGLIGKHDRTARAVLVRLEQRGYVQRVGKRGGWLPANIRYA